MNEGGDTHFPAGAEAACTQIEASSATVSRWLRGHTLLEFSIATALGAMLTGAMLISYAANLNMLRQQARLDRQAAASRAAAAVLTASLRQTGYRGVDAAPYGGSLLFGCSGRRIARGAPTHCGPASTGGDWVSIDYLADSASVWQTNDGKPKDCVGNRVMRTQGRWNWQRSEFYIGQNGARRYLACRNALARDNRGDGQSQVEEVDHLAFSYLLATSAVAVSASAMRPDDWAAVIGIDYVVTARDTTTAQAGRIENAPGRLGLPAAQRSLSPLAGSADRSMPSRTSARAQNQAIAGRIALRNSEVLAQHARDQRNIKCPR